MKNRVVKFAPSFLIDGLLGRATKFVSNLPNNIELLEIKYDLFSNQILGVIRSDNFQDLPEDQPTPELVLNYTPVSRVQQQPAITAEPHLAKQSQTQQSADASKIEEEFSPEQRRLLAFKTENGQVIVKPIQFLKTEWEDINEIVRSLGGRWIKGDFMSYWAVPV